MIFKRRKMTAEDQAAQIRADFAKKREVQGLFTPAQEELMDELGLTPGSSHEEIENKSPRIKKARDPLTARQRKLAKELGLLTDND